MRTLLQCTTLSEGVRQTDRENESDFAMTWQNSTPNATFTHSTPLPPFRSFYVPAREDGGCRAVAAIRAANGKGEKLYIPGDMTVISFVSSTEHLF